MDFQHKYRIAVLLFGAAYAAPNKGTIFFTDLDPYQQCYVKALIDFPVLFKANLIFKEF